MVVVSTGLSKAEHESDGEQGLPPHRHRYTTTLACRIIRASLFSYSGAAVGAWLYGMGNRDEGGVRPVTRISTLVLQRKPELRLYWRAALSPVAQRHGTHADADHKNWLVKNDLVAPQRPNQLCGTARANSMMLALTEVELLSLRLHPPRRGKETNSSRPVNTRKRAQEVNTVRVRTSAFCDRNSARLVPKASERNPTLWSGNRKRQTKVVGPNR